MLRRFEEVDSGPDVSSISEIGDFKSSTQLVSKLNDSFESTFMGPTGSEISLTSQNSFYEESEKKKPRTLTLQLPRAMKNSVPLRQSSVPRPVTVLKTVFLPDDTGNCNMPKKLTPNSLKKPSETSFFSFKETSPSTSLKKAPPDLSDLENQLIKKDALIETLRTRVAKMVEELENTHRKIAFSKGGSEELKELRQKCEGYEKKLAILGSKDKEQEAKLIKKDLEISNLTSELNAIKLENDGSKGRFFRLESELTAVKLKNSQLEGLNTSLQAQVSSSTKALELSASKLTQAENEARFAVNFKKTQETEFKKTIDDNLQTIQILSKQLQDSEDNSKNLQKLLSDSQNKYDSLNRTHAGLTSKLQALEEQLSSIDRSIRVPLQERKDQNFSFVAETPKVIERQFTFNTGENFRHKKSHSISSCSKSILREVMEVLEVGNSYEIIPCIRKLSLSHAEKKLVKKLTGFVRDCVFRDSRKVSPGQVWRLIKKVFEDYAALVKCFQISDINSVRQCLGDGNWAEKISTLTQEHKILRELLSKLRQKLKIPLTATVSEIELAISSIRLG